LPSKIRLIVGLGNPGREYERTRHNAGYWLVERFAVSCGIAMRKDLKYQALVGRHESGAWLLLPQTFMNASGRSVLMLAGFFRIVPEEILVVHDELDFAPGVAKLKQGGGIAGHNGLKDISQRLGTHEYWRLRLGVGKPPPGTEGGDYVLQKPPAEERAAVDAAIDNALGVMPQIFSGDLQGAMQKLHTQDRAVEAPKKEKQKASPPSAPEPAKPGFLKSLFGKK
jgi:peptidyl-tRNA hydrolase, PTH1 family